MKLNQHDLQYKELWTNKGYELPAYDRAALARKTIESPTWLHFGAGNIFRGFPAAVLQNLLNTGNYDRGLIVAEGYDYEIIEKAYRPYDNVSLLVVLKADGSIEKKVIGSIVSSVTANSANQSDWGRLVSVFENPTLQMVSFTITEKGYAITNGAGEYLPDVAADLTSGPASPTNIMAKICALCYKRYRKNGAPLALVSMDNCSHNGEKLAAAVNKIAEIWAEKGLVDPAFVDYLEKSGKVSFPWTMIDKITPRPDANVKTMLEKDGFEDTDIIITAKKTYTAPFVNAEEAQYLVVEDNFPNGRPPLEKGGVIFTSRDTVNMVEKMKVCTCLNPLHTALAVFGCLLSYKTIFEEMRDKDLVRLVEKIGYTEGMPVVVDPKIINPMDFIKEVLEVRFPNPFMPDTPQRIATDTSQKIPVRYGETIKAYLARPDLDVTSLEAIPFVLAGWCRYLLGINDDGKPFEISPDPRLAEMQSHLKGISLGEKGPFSNTLKPILSDATIFGVDLYQVGLAEKVEKYFTEMVAAPGAIRKALESVSK